MDDFRPSIRAYVDPEGRRFRYALVTHPEATTLGVHYSAFSSRPFLWGPNRSPRSAPGYFQRLRMLGSEVGHNWLFLCEEFGADGDGTYYTGQAGDFFVERAVRQVLRSVWDELGVAPEQTVMVGSSAGGTAALKFGLEFSCRGIVTICPHIDLDVCAARQNRMPHVAFICPDGDPLSEQNHVYTRQVSNLLGAKLREQAAIPRLFVQSCADDDGVHVEQVLPLVERWRTGGEVELDVRPEGGHTSDWAPRALLLDVIDKMFAGEPCDVGAYQHDPRFRGTPTKVPLWLRTRYRLGDVKRAMLRQTHA